MWHTLSVRISVKTIGTSAPFQKLDLVSESLCLISACSVQEVPDEIWSVCRSLVCSDDKSCACLCSLSCSADRSRSPGGDDEQRLLCDRQHRLSHRQQL